MPISPEMKHHYEGEAWHATRRAILRRADDKCECLGECGKHGGVENGYRCGRPNRSDYRNAKGVSVRVILTIAHLNHTPGDDRPENLRAWCAECHLAFDQAEHAKNAATTRRRNLQNFELFE